MFSYNLTSEELFDLNKADERRAGGAKFLRLGLAGGGAGLVRGAPNLGKMSGHGCNCQEG